VPAPSIELDAETLRAVFDALPTGIGIVDRETRTVVAANRAYRELTASPREALESELQELWAGSEHLLELLTDQTEERRIRQQLVQSGKLTAVGELAAGVAHEINNPLFAILGLTEFLVKEAEPGSKALERLELIQETGLEIKEIVRALLEFARENPEERHVVALEDVVRTTVDLVRRTNANKGVQIVERYDGSGALVHASPNQLKQVVLNLFANARQAMPGGGTVTVDVHGDGAWAVLLVADDGPGIPAELQGRIFEPFFTTKRTTSGTGLGLSVGLGIAEEHGGSLTVRSAPGAGAAFRLRLPRLEGGV
jgi:signal transduction histidine kinase